MADLHEVSPFTSAEGDRDILSHPKVAKYMYLVVVVLYRLMFFFFTFFTLDYVSSAM